MTPKAERKAGGTLTEYTVQSFGSSRDSDPEYVVDISPQHFGCSCKRDDYVLRPRRKTEGFTQDTICKHAKLAIVQFYIDNILNKNK